MSQRLRLTSDFALCLVLFGTARFMAAFWFTPRYSEFSDFHYPFAALSEHGLYPFVHYWLEYPPFFPYLSVAAYQLLGLFWPGGSLQHFHAYCITLQVLVAAFDIASAVLVFRLVARQSDKTRATFAGIAFCLSFAMSFAAAGYFDGLALFFMLWALDAFLDDKPFLAGLALGLGTATKIMPIVLLPALVKCRRSSGDLGRMLASLLLTTGLFWGSFFLINGELAFMPVKVNSVRQPWETVWALLEKHYGIGYLGWETKEGQAMPELPSAALDAVEKLPFPSKGTDTKMHRMRVLSRFSTDLSDFPSPAQPLIHTLSGLAFALLFLATWPRVSGKDMRAAIPYGGFLMILLLLYSKGWSPQFVIFPTAFLLLLFPTTAGVLALVGLMAINFIEMPIWLYYFGATEAGPRLLTAVVMARTLFLAVLAWSLYRKARRG